MTTTTITSLPALRELYAPVNPRSALKELPQLDAHAKRFISLSPFIIISSYGSDGRADTSPRGGEAGFVKVVNSGTLLIADSPGNNRLDSLENIIATGQIGLLFMVPGVDETLRVNGTAVLSTDESERKLCEDSRRVPKLVIRVSVHASYLHCAKALMRSDLWNANKHLDRSQLPSMGEMLRDQMVGKLPDETVFETQEQMLVRYQQTL
jgi:PPOX class probable FMN-dependent enzyme